MFFFDRKIIAKWYFSNIQLNIICKKVAYIHVLQTGIKSLNGLSLIIVLPDNILYGLELKLLVNSSFSQSVKRIWKLFW